MTTKIVVLCIVGVVIGFFGSQAVKNDLRGHQEETKVVASYEFLPPYEDLPSLVRAVEVVATGEVVSTQSFLEKMALRIPSTSFAWSAVSRAMWRT